MKLIQSKVYQHNKEPSASLFSYAVLFCESLILAQEILIKQLTGRTDGRTLEKKYLSMSIFLCELKKVLL